MERTCHVQQVPVERLASVWGQVAPWIESALPYSQGDEDLTGILVKLSIGAYSLWYEPGRFAAVTQTLQHQRQTVCTVMYAGGVDLRALSAAFDFARNWCREHEVRVLRVCGREGWEKQLSLKRVGVILQEEVV